MGLVCVVAVECELLLFCERRRGMSTHTEFKVQKYLRRKWQQCAATIAGIMYHTHNSARRYRRTDIIV